MIVQVARIETFKKVTDYIGAICSPEWGRAHPTVSALLRITRLAHST